MVQFSIIDFPQIIFVVIILHYLFTWWEFNVTALFYTIYGVEATLHLEYFSWQKYQVTF